MTKVFALNYTRKRFLRRRIKYSVNSLASFNPAVYMLTRSGENLLNPGPQLDCIPEEERAMNYHESCENSSSMNALDLNDKHWIIHLNCRSLIPHIDEIRLFFKDISPLFIAVSETWLDDSVDDSEVKISGYSIERLDRKNRRGGGVALYVLDGVKYTRREDLEDESSEAIWVQTKLRKTKYLIGCVYRAPNESLEMFNYMDDVLRLAIRNKIEVIVLGDLNCDCLNVTLRQTERFIGFLISNDLEQLIKEPSRVTSNTISLIDVLITSTPGLFKASGVLNSNLSDHYPIYGIINSPSKCPSKHRILFSRTWNDNNVNDFLNDLQQTPWSVLDSFSDINDMCFAWESLFVSVIDQHFPMKRKRIRKNTHPWLDGTVLRLMRQRDMFHKKAVRSGCISDWNEYRRLRNQVTSRNRKARKNYFSAKLKRNRTNPKAFWSTLRLVIPGGKNRNEIDKLVVDGKELCDKQDIANSLNDYFTSIASSLLASRPSPDYDVISDQTESNPSVNGAFTFRKLSEADVYRALRTLDVSKATGADNISAKVLKIAAPCISQVLTNIFNESFQGGHFPSSWKVARVVSLFKGGVKTERDNQRPISVLPCISKVQESFANSDLQVFAQEVGLIDQHQFAYVKHSSTTTALIRAVDSWKKAIDKGEKVVCAFLDLRKAFDVIDHQIVIGKLAKNGVQGKEQDWFRSYLSQRYQFVTCGTAQSQRRLISHGVPQGSVLGPTLFNIHINGISKACNNCDVVLYADDTGLYAASKDVSIAEQKVNDDLGRIDEWLTQNGLVSNTKKSEVMLIGSRPTVKNTRKLQIIFDGNSLKQSDHFKYLGVDIDSCLNWNTHISCTSSRIYPKLKLLNRISAFLSYKILLNIYKQTILPILDYGCIVWGDCGKGNAQRLERLQNQAMRIILRANRLTCTQEMRTKLVLLSLSNRRRFLRLQLVYKIVNNINCPYQLVNYLVRRSDLHNRSLRDATLLHLPKTKSAMGQSTFQYAAASEWNNLPRALRELKTLSKFKAAIFTYFIELDRKDHVCSIR